MVDDQVCVCCTSRCSSPHLPGLRRCLQCGHVWAAMTLSAEHLCRLYGRSYFEGNEYSNYCSEAAALECNFRCRMAELARYVPQGARLREIGCAYGYFLWLASQQYKVDGCEVSEHAAEHARQLHGLEVAVGDYLAMPLTGPYDAICMWDTIEHLSAPDRYVGKAASELRSGGVLALSTGDISSRLARWRGARWRLIHPPTHLHYFTADSIRVLLSRCGFHVLEITYPTFWRSADAVAFRLLCCSGGRHGTFLYRLLRRFGLTQFTFPLRTFDLMVVYAKRR